MNHRSAGRTLVMALVVAAAAATFSCQPCPQQSDQSTIQPAAAAGLDATVPVIGITGYVIEPGTRGDNGLGNFRVTRTYRDAVARAGAVPVHLVPVPEEEIDRLLDRLDAIVLAGGPDIDPAAYGEEPHPSISILPAERQQFDIALARRAIARQMPILGICLGSQELNVLHGGAMVQDIPSEVESDLSHREVEVEAFRRGVHQITIVEGTPLAELYDQLTFEVNSAHHQASDPLGEGLEVAARAPDGVIEGFYRPDYSFLIGVQYHPEGQQQPAGLHDRLFDALVEAASSYRASRGEAAAQ